MADLTLVIGNKNYSSWSLRPWYYLTVSGLTFREIRIALDQADTRENIAAYSPTLRVPVLLDGDHRVWESLAICEHAAERFGLPAWPDEPGPRAIARSVAHEMHAGFQALRSEMPMNLRARRRLRPSAAAERDIARVISIWSDNRTRFGAAGPWLFGAFGIADAMYAPVVQRFMTYGIDLPAAAREYTNTVIAHPAMQAWTEAALAETEIVDADEAGEELTA